MDMVATQAISRSIRVRGQVQGVGFRPFVWQLARRFSLRGHVTNDGEGVSILVVGDAGAIDLFVRALTEEAPPLARVTGVEMHACDGETAGADFVIADSLRGGSAATGIVADAATCPACRSEIFDPADRRYSYAFGNCTHCGPRLSIIRAVPYDRATTSMAPFALCADCAGEYVDPADRRFHAQPTACPNCGPGLWLEGEGEGAADPIAEAARLLRAGRIVAVKGIGGFHLACLARDAAVVAELRRRKARDAKPFALMVASVEQARDLCILSAEEEALLAGRAAPIVLLRRRGDGPALPDALAPGQDHLGIMLAYTPLHHLLLAAVGAPLVMTSGNRSDEPQCTDNDAARSDLAGLADAWLMHDRAIVNRVDDSVVAHDTRGAMTLRRARGMAPDPIQLPSALDCDVPILAMGGALKATFCLLRGREAILSQHIGDLEHAGALSDYRRMLDLFRALFAFTPGIIAVDGHADYLSTQLGRRIGAELNIPVMTVAHHHAHMAACLAEHDVAPDIQSLAILCDGLGLGADGTLWGGEVLSGNYVDAERIAGLPAVPLPGGSAAMKQPWRNLVAHLVAAFGPHWRQAAAPLSSHLPDDAAVGLVERAMAVAINSPACSSAGRLFDAVAAALGVHADRISHEGQAAMALEALSRPHMAGAYAYAVGMERGVDGLLRPRLADLWHCLARDMGDGVEAGRIGARFHRTFCAMMAGLLPDAPQDSPVALSGGVLQNRIIRSGLAHDVEARGLRPLLPHSAPAGDGGLSLGQVAVAAARVKAGQIIAA